MVIDGGYYISERTSLEKPYAHIDYHSTLARTMPKKVDINLRNIGLLYRLQTILMPKF